MPDVHVVPSGNLWACEIDGKRRPARARFLSALDAACSSEAGLTAKSTVPTFA